MKYSLQQIGLVSSFIAFLSLLLGVTDIVPLEKCYMVAFGAVCVPISIIVAICANKEIKKEV